MSIFLTRISWKRASCVLLYWLVTKVVKQISNVGCSRMYRLMRLRHKTFRCYICVTLKQKRNYFWLICFSFFTPPFILVCLECAYSTFFSLVYPRKVKWFCLHPILIYLVCTCSKILSLLQQCFWLVRLLVKGTPNY